MASQFEASMYPRIVWALALIVLSAHALSGQRQREATPLFRAQVEAVEIDAFVTDAQGNPVTDLRVDEFEILEDGRPQTITAFTLVDIPIDRLERPLFSPTAIEPDVATNRGGEGRLYVIALDEVRPDLALRARRFLRRFIEQHVAANDVAAIVYVGRGRASDAQDFTSSRRLLLQAVEKFSGGFGQQAMPAGLSAAGDFDASLARESEWMSRSRMRALRDLLLFMGELRGRRKALLYVTEELGDVYSVLDYNGGARSIAFDDLHTALTAATRGNVSIYPIDPRGLSPEGGLGDAEVAPAPAGAGGLARRQELRALAEATGGFAVVDSNSYDAAFARIVRENSTYYVLGFTSTNDRRDGRYRKLEVRVTRPGLEVRSRDGYVAPRRPLAESPPPADTATLSAAVAQALSIPMPNPAVPMSAFAAAYKGEGRDAQIAIVAELDAGRLDLVQNADSIDGVIEIAALAVNATGDVRKGEFHRASLTLMPETYERTRREGIRVLSVMSLPPGRYQLRVAVGNTAAAGAGSVMYDLEVPDFTSGPLVMSGVSLTSDAVANVFTVAPDTPLGDILSAPPTTTREFSRGDTLTVYAEVYENRRGGAVHDVELEAELRSDVGVVMHSVTETRSSSELESRSGGYGFFAELPLHVDPGLYVVRVHGRANIGDRPTVSRDVQIRVR